MHFCARCSILSCNSAVSILSELTPLSCIACMTICCSVHKSALTYKEIIFSTFSNQYVLCICICLISCTESKTYAHVDLRDGGPVFRAPLCRLGAQCREQHDVKVQCCVVSNVFCRWECHLVEQASSSHILALLTDPDRSLIQHRAFTCSCISM